MSLALDLFCRSPVSARLPSPMSRAGGEREQCWLERWWGPRYPYHAMHTTRGGGAKRRDFADRKYK